MGMLDKCYTFIYNATQNSHTAEWYVSYRGHGMTFFPYAKNSSTKHLQITCVKQEMLIVVYKIIHTNTAT